MTKETAAVLRTLLAADVEAAGFDLEEVTVTRAGSRSVVRVVLDRDGDVDLDAVAEASRVVSTVLDAHEDAVPGAYSLEVTSPGVDRPLTEARHWRRNIGRLVSVTRVDGTALTGRITAADAECVTVDRMVLAYPEIRRGAVEVEFSHAAGASLPTGVGDSSGDDAAEDEA